MALAWGLSYSSPLNGNNGDCDESQSAKIRNPPNIASRTSVYFDIAIIGAGLSGLALAAGLANRGFSVCVVEKQSSFDHLGSALSLSANALKALDELSPIAGKALRSKGCVYTPPGESSMPTEGHPYQVSFTCIDTVEQKTSRGDEQKEEEYEENGNGTNNGSGMFRRIMTPWWCMRDILLQSLPPSVAIYLDSSVVLIDDSTSDSFVKVTVDKEAVLDTVNPLPSSTISVHRLTISSRLLVGCDGANSYVREWLDLPKAKYGETVAARGWSDNVGLFRRLAKELICQLTYAPTTGSPLSGAKPARHYWGPITESSERKRGGRGKDRREGGAEREEGKEGESKGGTRKRKEEEEDEQEQQRQQQQEEMSLIPFISPTSPTTPTPQILPSLSSASINGLFITGLQKCFSFFVLKDLEGHEKCCWVSTCLAVLPPPHTTSHVPFTHPSAAHTRTPSIYTHPHQPAPPLVLPRDPEAIAKDTKARYSDYPIIVSRMIDLSKKETLSCYFLKQHELPFIAPIMHDMGGGKSMQNKMSPKEDIGWGGRGRVTLLGDAAHSMRPVSGQGCAMAFEDAVVLVRKLETFVSMEKATCTCYPCIPSTSLDEGGTPNEKSKFSQALRDKRELRRCIAQFEVERLIRVKPILDDQRQRAAELYKKPEEMREIPPWTPEFNSWVMKGV